MHRPVSGLRTASDALLLLHCGFTVAELQTVRMILGGDGGAHAPESRDIRVWGLGVDLERTTGALSRGSGGSGIENGAGTVSGGQSAEGTSEHTGSAASDAACSLDGQQKRSN